MIDVDEVAAMQHAAIVRWHHQGLDNPYAEFLGIACHECALNFQLWHEEDSARDPAAEDARIARVKRTIDQLNQQRNNHIEQMDVWIAERLAAQQIQPAADAPLNTETLGSAIDRLAIMALRIYHLEEQLQREDVVAEHLQNVESRLSICQRQHADLTHAARQLQADIFSGRKRHQVYRQLKMYNDPSLNPYLYRTTAWRQASPTPTDEICRDSGRPALPASH